MKNIVVFTYGDSSNPKTWSNVPYMLTTTLEKKGYNVIRVDMSTKKTPIYYIHSLFFKIIKPQTTYYYVRSKLNRKKVEKKIKEAVNKYDSIADLYISISFDFSPKKFTNKKVLLISDWVIEYAIEERFNRKPDKYELKDIKRHKEVVEGADYRVSLFKDSADFMNKRFKGKTDYLGLYINGFKDHSEFKDIKDRYMLTFIGTKAYYDGAKELIKSFEKLNDSKLELHIIGMTKKDFPNLKNNNIYFHGYLNKGNKVQCEEYYNILKHTLVVINTSNKWAGLSSILESMYYYRPIITSKYPEFVKNFGDKIDFGYYCNNNSDDIIDKIKLIQNLSSKDYEKLTINSHKKVEKFTYDSYVDKIINLVK